MCYMAHTPHLGLVYHSPFTSSLRVENYLFEEDTSKQPPLQLEAYSDSNYTGHDPSNAKSTTGNLIFFAGALIAWSSSLQPTIATSSAEAEYTAAYDTSRYIIYFRQFLEELGFHSTSCKNPTRIWEDNTACISQSKNPTLKHYRTRHIKLHSHYLRDLVSRREVQLEYISTTDQLADILTKPLPPRDFLRLSRYIARPAPAKCISTSSSSA